jgi:hypothetical protein
MRAISRFRLDRSFQRGRLTEDTVLQTDYADTFVKAMLSWVRYIAGSIAKMFQSEGAAVTSSGGMLLSWFRSNWVGLLLFLLLVGLGVDFLVWIIRWRPYWLWFRKKRVLLENDIDVDLDEEQLKRRYGGKPPPKPRRQGPILPDVEEEYEILPVKARTERKKAPWMLPDEYEEIEQEKQSGEDYWLEGHSAKKTANRKGRRRDDI